MNLSDIQKQIEKMAREYGLDPFETIFELVDAKQLYEVAAYGGFPTRYPHWRFGMDFDQMTKSYDYGFQKIYELVINNDPCYAYLMNSNSLVDQKIVIAHVYAHSDFFKSNQYFKSTDRKMMDKIANHAVRIRAFQEQYGVEEVENFIDVCLSIENLINIYRPYKPEEQIKAKEKDILGFLMNHAPLEEWQAEILSIVREEAYYFIPQGQTKIMNEGWASFWHSKILTEGILNDPEIIDFADHHAGALVSHPGQINPYKLGIEIFRNIEDRWNKGQFGKEYEDCEDIDMKKNWDKKLDGGLSKIFEVRKLYNDITFIDEFLTPELCEKQKLFVYHYNKRNNTYEIVDRDTHKVKEKLLFSLTNLGQPFMYVKENNFEGKGELLLEHDHQGIDLKIVEAKETLERVQKLWKKPVNLETIINGEKRLLIFDGKEHREKTL